QAGVGVNPLSRDRRSVRVLGTGGRANSRLRRNRAMRSDTDSEGSEEVPLSKQSTTCSSRRGFAGMDEDEQREIEYGRFEGTGGPRDWDAARPRSRSRSSSWDDDYDRGRGRSSRRGFAAMDEDEQRDIARRGGEASALPRA